MPFSVWFNHTQIISRAITITSDYLFTEDNITDNNNSVINNNNNNNHMLTVKHAF